MEKNRYKWSAELSAKNVEYMRWMKNLQCVLQTDEDGISLFLYNFEHLFS
jgi:hypothetical protein